MSGNLPFGFQPPDDGEDPNQRSGGFDMGNLVAALESLGRMLQTGGEAGAVNWEMAKQIGRQHEVQRSDPGVSESERSAVSDAVQLANTWLDGACSFAASNAAAVAWSRGEWLDGTLPAWQRYITPVAEQVQGTMTDLLGGQGLPGGGEIPGMESEQLQALLGPLSGITKQLGSAMFATQAGQGLGMLSGEVLSASDIGIPLTPDGRPTLLPGNVNVFADSLELPRQDVLVYVALRECAHQRLFTHVSWLRSRLEEAVAAYARGIHVDTSAIEEAMGQVDPTNPESMQNIMAEGMFQPQDSPEQKAALARLETLLALVEGWVEVVVADAAGDRLPTLPQLTEAMRRRRAAGGPAEKTFANLVGLELRPRRLREASAYWNRVTEGDVPTRDNRWEHPDLLPTAEDLDDLDGFFAGLEVPEIEASVAAELTEIEETIAEAEADSDDEETDSDSEPESNS